MIPIVLSALRAATGEHHRRLDQGLDLPSRLADPAARRGLVARLYGLQAGLERAMGEQLAKIEGLALETRRRAHRFDRDLSALGAPPPEALEPCPVPLAAGPAEALGLLYVSEGSTLGGKVIRKGLAARGAALTGLDFLNPYGPDTADMWQAFLQVLDREGRQNPDAVVRGGVVGFTCAVAWVCSAEAAA